MAIARLGGSSLLSESQSVKHIVLDPSLADMLNSLMACGISQEKKNSMINDLKTTLVNQKSLIEKHENKIQQLEDSLQKRETETQNLATKFSDTTGSIAKSKEEIEEDDKVPIEIKLMSDKKYVPLYLKLLESGSEKKRDIRLVILGKKGSGKTSFLKRLLREDINTIRTVTSTDGISIHRTRCNVNSDDSIWNKFDVINEETTRLLKPFEETIKSKVTESNDASAAAAVPKTAEDNKLQTSFQQPEIVQAQVTETQLKSPVATESPDQLPSLRLQQASRDIDKMLESVVDLSDKDEYGTLLLWDFAGDEEFYHTHQTFLSPDAIYIVLTKLNEADDRNAQEMFQLWMDSIHCYCRIEEQTNTAESNTATMHERMRDKYDFLDPPVVLVGSHKDKVEPSEGEETEDACSERLYRYAKNVLDDACGHIRKEYFISNTEDDDSKFDQIRLDILNLAKSRRSWNSEYPLKFIQLEKRLKETKTVLEIPILSFRDIKKISTETTKPLNNEELMLYMKFHHEIRALVYFEDLHDYIILDTQWLSDVFKSVVTAQKFQSNIRRYKNKSKWNDFHERGILHSDVLEDIFENNQNIFEYKNHILNVMEKFDIIICPKISEGDFAINEKPCYYVPCMIKKEPECDIYEMFNVTENTCSKSNWLCFKFRFLPPHLPNHLIASLCRKYEVAEVGISNQTKRQFALFRGTTVFELQKTTKLRKLLLMTYANFILIQILEFGKNASMQRDLYKHIKDLVTDEINNIINRRFKMTNVNYEKKWECGITKPGFVTGSNDFSEEQIIEYYCNTCKINHKCNNEWSDIQNEMLSLSPSSVDTPETNSKTENTRKPYTLLTKVRCHAHCDMRTVSNVSEESSRAGSLTQFTNEEYNFAKMGMIVLYILADALYDLLRQDKPNLRSRNSCDLSFLYSEHRKLNKHIPSNSWGGQWQRIQNTDILIGDDIERMRLTRNDMQHASSFKLDDKRFKELCDILVDVLKRFNQHNKPTRLYTDHFDEILAKNISDEEMKSIRHCIQNEIKSEMVFDVEIEQQLHV
ncbi:unnamed protein product [Mytilus edulis]|uniref:non-specific serine/threonine protein kinase n=1 Tax=Mytilus edulis TaxID=6550 RepID=A0A8S3QI61_MYTED|nr:unnamed protein product [Mytilus edulis]